MPKASQRVWTCWVMPLSLAPTATRLPARPATLSMGVSAKATKKIGPALAGDTMRSPMAWSNGAVPCPARGTQLEAMKPNSISPRSSRLALSMLAELRVSSQHSSGGRDSLKTWATAMPWVSKVPPVSAVPILKTIARPSSDWFPPLRYRAFMHKASPLVIPARTAEEIPRRAAPIIPAPYQVRGRNPSRPGGGHDKPHPPPTSLDWLARTLYDSSHSCKAPGAPPSSF